MTNSDEEDTILNVRIPSSLATRLEEVYLNRGFKNKSEFVRSAIRDAINPPKELSEESLKDIEKSKEQIKEGKTTSLSDLATPNDLTEGAHGDLQALFSESRGIDSSEINVLVIGCGGAGSNIVDRFSGLDAGNIQTLLVDTDRRHLSRVEADTKLLIGKSSTDGLGTAADPEVGKQAAKSAEDQLKDIISGRDIVFVAAGFGGGTGSGAAPIITELASETGAVTMGLVTLPFELQKARSHRAQEAIEEIRSKSDSVIIFDHNLLLDHVDKITIGETFFMMEQIIADSISSLVGTFSDDALVDIDFADFRTVVQGGNVGGMLVGEGSLENKEEVIEDTLQHPLINADVSAASRGLVQISGSNKLNIEDAEEIVESIYQRITPEQSLIWGAQTNEHMDNKIRVMVLLTGLEFTPEKITEHISESESPEDIEIISGRSFG